VSKDPIKEFLKDPDKRAKYFLFITGAMILSTILIVIGTIVFILRLLNII
jgi:prolipoprotein diacylglyceryltransferase